MRSHLPRHMQLLGDIRTHKGGVLRVTRFGLAKMSDSAQKGTSFPQDHLTRILDRVLHAKRRGRRRARVHHLSECIIRPSASSVRAHHPRPVHEHRNGRFHGRQEANDDPRDLVAKRIVFEEGCVTTLEFNTPTSF